MPVPASPKDERLIVNLQCTMERVYGDVPDADDPATYLVRKSLNPVNIVYSERELRDRQPACPRRFIDSDLTRRWLWLKNAALTQTHEVCRAMISYLSLSEVNLADMAGILGNTTHIGRQFGLLPSYGSFDRLSRSAENHPSGLIDNEATRRMKDNPRGWFELSAGRLDFSSTAKDSLRAAYHPNVGCTALSTTVEIGGRRVNMYNMFWTTFVNDFVDDYVRSQTAKNTAPDESQG